MAFAVGAGGEIKRIKAASPDAIAERQAPKTIDDERIAVGPVQRALERAGHWVVGVDPPVPEVPDQKIAAERAETRRRDLAAPTGESSAPWETRRFVVAAVEIEQSIKP